VILILTLLLLHLFGLYFCVGAAIATVMHKAFADGLEWREWLFLIFQWPRLLLEAKNI
jgi:hypothetical protein